MNRALFKRSDLILVGISAIAPAAVVLSGLLPVSAEVRTDDLPIDFEFVLSTVVGIIALVWSLGAARSRQWGSALLALGLLLFLLLPLVSLFYNVSTVYDRTWGRLRYANRILTFLTLKPTYDQEIDAPPKPGSAIKLFVWHEDLEGGYGVAYDPDGSLARGAARLPALPSNRSNYSRGLCKITYLGSHYYLVSFGCSVSG
jgi:hypothetical protein